uniref:Fibronectin type-III domain-containing protein n=2 Tax=Sphaeramia orbicularis TaxID=375764 RepID=A0A673BGB0_9TELE
MTRIKHLFPFIQMDPAAGKPIEMAALGRPFNLGMLYDCRRDALVPSMTLWDREDLEKDTRETPKPNSETEIVASESIEAKSSALKVEASLKASFLGGLVEVDGSAKYLNDHKTSKNQARVTLKYNTTTKFKELTMNHLGRGNVKHPYVFDKGIATHVVTGILYGAQAFFVFDREVSENEKHQDIQGNLKVMIKKIPFVSIEGEGSLKMDDQERANTETFSCKFHGDFRLEKSPVSYQDAVEVYQSLPKLLGPNDEKAVPVKVWLLPLTALDSSAAKLVREISIRLIQESQSVLEEFVELEMRCNDAVKTTTAQQFPQIGQKVKKFRAFCSEFKLEFQRTLAKKLPTIRGGGEDEAELAEILKKRHSSPFNSKSLNEWMDCKEREICILKSFTKMMKHSKIVPSQSALIEEVFSTEHAVTFVFTSLGNAEPYLSALENHLTEKTGNPADPRSHDVEKEQWYLSKDVTDTLRNKAKLFSDFAETNKENKNIKFLTVALTDETHKGSSIYLYKDGFSVSDNFEPPSKPERVTVSDVSYNSVTLKISPPRFGVEGITSYCVEYCVCGEDGWQQTTAPKAEEATVSGLSPNTEYMFRCRAVTPVGLGPAAQVSDPSKTLPCSPPGTPQTESNSSEISISWEKPAEIGQDVHILSYIIEYTEMDGDDKADLQWNQMVSGSEKVIISGLQSETGYAVRVRCDCGVDGRSKESITIKISTTKREFERLADYLKHISKNINSDSPTLYKLPLKEKHIDIDGCRMFSLGKDSMRHNRTIMLLGATGSGKSTLINGMFNYIIGMEWKDNFRFKLIHEDLSKSQAESQTSEVTVYKVNYQEGFKIPFSLTVVDTPGFGDTRGIARDKEITEQIRKLFTSTNGVSDIDALCFVTQASLARLTATQRYVFDSVLSIFGKDVAENIQMLVTFADGKQPPVLEAINVSEVPCPKNDLGLPVHFKFNNSALFADNRCTKASSEDSDDDSDNFDEMFWNMGFRSMEKFFTALGQMTTKSLLMTKEVLKERKHLETVVEGLQPQVRAGLAKLEEIKTTKEKIKEHETIMVSNENFEIEVDVVQPVKVELTKKGEFITNCAKCNITCHYPCAIEDDAKKDRCAAMDMTGNCKICPEKCPWNIHFNQTYRWEYVSGKEKQTLRALKEKYEQATSDKLNIQELIERQEEEIELLQDTIMSLIDQSAKCLTRLQEIALRPNPLTAPEYIDMLIQAENTDAKPGFQARIQALEAMRDRAKVISKVARQNKLANTEQQQSPERQNEEKEKKKGFFNKIAGWLSL